MGISRFWGSQERHVQLAMPTGIGAIIAVIVLVLAIVLMVVGQMDLKVGAMIAALAVARLT